MARQIEACSAARYAESLNELDFRVHRRLGANTLAGTRRSTSARLEHALARNAQGIPPPRRGAPAVLSPASNDLRRLPHELKSFEFGPFNISTRSRSSTSSPPTAPTITHHQRDHDGGQARRGRAPSFRPTARVRACAPAQTSARRAGCKIDFGRRSGRAPQAVRSAACSGSTFNFVQTGSSWKARAGRRPPPPRRDRRASNVRVLASRRQPALFRRAGPAQHRLHWRGWSWYPCSNTADFDCNAAILLARTCVPIDPGAASQIPDCKRSVERA